RADAPHPSAADELRLVPLGLCHPTHPGRPRRRGDRMTRRRDFVTLLGGAAAWGVLMSLAADDPDAPPHVSAFAQGLQERSWTVGGNVRIDYRWGAGDLDRFRAYAAELVALKPDVVVATAASIVAALQQASRTVPIVFVTTI